MYRQPLPRAAPGEKRWKHPSRRLCWVHHSHGSPYQASTLTRGPLRKCAGKIHLPQAKMPTTAQPWQSYKLKRCAKRIKTYIITPRRAGHLPHRPSESGHPCDQCYPGRNSEKHWCSLGEWCLHLHRSHPHLTERTQGSHLACLPCASLAPGHNLARAVNTGTRQTSRPRRRLSVRSTSLKGLPYKDALQWWTRRQRQGPDTVEESSGGVNQPWAINWHRRSSSSRSKVHLKHLHLGSSINFLISSVNKGLGLSCQTTKSKTEWRELLEVAEHLAYRAGDECGFAIC